MKKPLLFILIIITINSNAQVLNELVPDWELKGHSILKPDQINYPGDPTFDIQYYKLNLNLSYSPNNLTGEVRVTAKSLRSNLSRIFLDFSNNMSVDSVLDESGSLFYTHSGSKINITLDHPLNSGDLFTIDIFYHGVPAYTGLGSFAFDLHSGQPSIWTLSEPYGSRDWWPCKDTPADKADSSDVWITCDPNLIGVSNGILTETLLDRNGKKTYKWKSRYPIANYLISIAVSNYAVYQDYFKYISGGVRDSMLVIHYIYPENLEALKPQLDKTIPMLEIFSDLFGPYPFLKEKYGHAEFGRGGMEHQTISSMGIFTDGVIAHELAHQWFGDKITCRTWENIWLNEGFATFCEGIYLEKSQDKDAYNLHISSIMDRAKIAKGTIYVQDLTNISEIFSNSRTYAKGGVVLHMLRGVLGDSLFFKTLRTYINDSSLSYGTAVTEDFQYVAETVSDSSLEYFFDQWIYGENYPKYFIDWSYEPEGGNLYRVDIQIEQAENTTPGYFTMPVEFKISTSIKDSVFRVLNDKPTQKYRFLVEGKPVNLIFDPDNLILKDADVTDPGEIINLQSYLLAQNYPNPFNNTTTLRFRLPRRTTVKLRVFDIIGNEIDMLVNKEMDAGIYSIPYSPSFLSSGVYFYRLEAEDYSDTKKFILLK